MTTLECESINHFLELEGHKPEIPTYDWTQNGKVDGFVHHLTTATSISHLLAVSTRKASGQN